MVQLIMDFNNAGCLSDIWNKYFLKINEKVDKEIIKELFLNYKIINKMKGTGRKHLLMRETLINIYKNKDNIFNDKNL